MKPEEAIRKLQERKKETRRRLKTELNLRGPQLAILRAYLGELDSIVREISRTELEAELREIWSGNSIQSMKNSSPS